MRRRPLLQTIALSMAITGCTALDQDSSTQSPVTDSPDPTSSESADSTATDTASEEPADDTGWLSVQWSEEIASDISVSVRVDSGEAVFSETIRAESSADPRHQGFTDVFETTGAYEVSVRVAGAKQTKEIQATLDSSSGWRGVNVHVTSGPEISITSIAE